MSFSPFARFRNFNLKNLKALLDVYPDAAKTMEWNEAANEIEEIGRASCRERVFRAV